MLIESLMRYSAFDVFRGGIIAIALKKLSFTRKITLNSN